MENTTPRGRPTASALRFDRTEWAGAFGDLGTLIPFVVAYIALGNIDPLSIMLTFGVCMCAAGFYYRTPFPVQPMKAIGVAAATQAQVGITAGAIYGAGVVTGVVWLLIGVTGAASAVRKVLARPVAVGIILGLGLGFMLEGMKLMSAAWLISGIGLVGSLVLLESRRFPVMFLLLMGGAAYQLSTSPELLEQLTTVEPAFRMPSFTWPKITLHDLSIALVVLALPQLPLTLGNAIVAITEENNRLFPEHPVTERKVAVSTGLMNLFASAFGGVPMCHGAGGMAGHVRFGATTGGAPILLGLTLIILGMFFSRSIATLLQLFPGPILGVILFLTGAQLALGSCEFGTTKNDRFVTIVTTAFAIWNVGAAFVAGLALHAMLERKWIKL